MYKIIGVNKMTPRNDFQVEKARCDKALDRTAVEKADIIPGKGSCAADPKGTPDIPQLRRREWYLEKIIKSLLERGEIDDGTKTPFDDRKLRYDGSWLNENIDFERIQFPTFSTELIVNFGITHYKAFLADVNRSDEENLKLQERGLKEYNDRYAFFARAPGVAVLPINQDGTIFIGERANPEFGGFLNAVAGHLTYKDNTAKIDVIRDVYKELKEELGIEARDVFNLRFVGLYSHPIQGHLDFTFLANVAKPEQYFASGEWKKSVKEREHKDLVRLATMDEIQELLETGKVPSSDRTLGLMYSTRGALMSVYANEIRN